MAIHTFIKFQAGVGPPRSVTRLTRNRHMLSFQGITGLAIMVKGRTLGQPPALRVVAAFAIVPQAVGVGVFMAIGAELVRHVGERKILFVLGCRCAVHHRGVAIGTGRNYMLTGQDKLSLAMVEPRCRPPAVHRMAGKAGPGKQSPMFIQMTAGAGALQSQKSFLEVFFLLQEFVFIHNIFGLMAGLALQRGVPSFQRKAGLGMVKLILPLFKPDHLKIPSMMIRMAVLAFLEQWLAVNSLSFLDALLKNAMAVQAFISRYPFVRRVAAGAVFNPLQKGVGLVQFSRRQLGLC